MKIGEKISILRKAKGFSQEDLGLNLSNQSSGVSRQSVSEWESGKSEPKLDNIKALAKLLDVSFDALLDEDLDLNDPETLSKVISKNISSSYENRTKYSIHYSIYEYVPFKKKCLKNLIFSIAGSLITIIGIILSIHFMDANFATEFPIVLTTALIGGVTFTPIIIFIIDFKYWLKNKDGRKLANLDYKNFIIYPTAKDYSNKSIYLPISKITNIQKLAADVKHCSVEIIFEENGTTRKYILNDINNPDRLIAVFNDTKEFISEEKKQEKTK